MNPLWKALNYWRRRQIHSLRSPPLAERANEKIKIRVGGIFSYISFEVQTSALSFHSPGAEQLWKFCSTSGRCTATWRLYLLGLCHLWEDSQPNWDLPCVGEGVDASLCSLCASKVECLAEAAFLRPSELWRLCISPSSLFICRPFKTLS